MGTEELLKYLESIKKGPISDTGKLEDFLVACWDDFDGSDSQGMAGWKLKGRMEEVYWDSPSLNFVIERHGGAALGSTRAELQVWNVDIYKKIADCLSYGYRQVSPRQPKLDLGPITEKIAQQIINRQKDKRLKWNKDGSVRILIGKILPEYSAVKQTLVGRRKRFRNSIDKKLNEAGWRRIKPNLYAPP